MRNYYIFVAALGVFLLVLLIIGFTSVSNPFKEKERKDDQTRSSDLTMISNEIKQYYQNNNYTLPDTIPAPSSTYSTYSTKDPETGRNYEYTKTSSGEFELCASFQTDTRPETNGAKTSTATLPRYDGSYVDTNTHPEGRYCFKYNACLYGGCIPTPTPYLYPPAPPIYYISPAPDNPGPVYYNQAPQQAPVYITPSAPAGNNSVN